MIICGLPFGLGVASGFLPSAKLDFGSAVVVGAFWAATVLPAVSELSVAGKGLTSGKGTFGSPFFGP